MICKRGRENEICYECANYLLKNRVDTKIINKMLKVLKKILMEEKWLPRFPLVFPYGRNILMRWKIKGYGEFTVTIRGDSEDIDYHYVECYYGLTSGRCKEFFTRVEAVTAFIDSFYLRTIQWER